MTSGLEDVSVYFAGQCALDGVSFPVVSGEVTVVVGGDGAGKTTALRCLAGVVEASSGRILRPAKERIGYVPATGGVFADLTVEENMQFAAAAYHVAQSSTRIAEILDRVGLSDASSRLAGRLSGGMARKLAVGMTLLHSPELLILDEPTTGVDPVSRFALWHLISAAAAAGAAVVVATTYVNEAARATTVVLLSGGRVLANGSPDDILAGVTGVVGCMTATSRPSDMAWRRGLRWQIWQPDGVLPPGAEAVEVDLEDAVVVAELAGRS